MRDCKVIEAVNEKRNNIMQKNSTALKHQIESKFIKTVGNVNANGVTVTTTAASTSSASAIISLKSDAVGKSTVSSISMSLERKDSIHYMPTKIGRCTIPAGQNTVIHLDNYSHFMAQRVTTKTSFKSSGIVIEDQNSNNIVQCSTNKASSIDIGLVGVGLTVVGGTNSLYNNNKKSLKMNKQKVQATKLPATPSKVKCRETSLECKKSKAFKINVKKDRIDTSTLIKPVVKKANRRGKKVVKPRQPKKSKIKANSVQDIVKEKTDELEKSQNSPFVTPPGESKLLRPCIYTLQSKKCLHEMTCSHMHSDFPCKYYYLNIPCPEGFKCQFMHNGPLQPKLKEALRNHILDLLSMNPSAVETYFVQQIHLIDDLSKRLQSFQIKQDPSNEIIELIDDGDEDNALVIDESSDDISTNVNGITNTNTPPNMCHESDEIHPHYSIDKLDMIYEKFKETNYAVDDIDKKLKCLKTNLNITPKEKVRQLQIIYDLLKEQEKQLQIYENATSASQIIAGNNKNNSSLILANENERIEDPNVVLVNPNIVNDIVTLGSQEYITTLSDEENSTAAYKDTEMSTNFADVERVESLAHDEDDFIIVTDDENNTSVCEHFQEPPQAGEENQTEEQHGSCNVSQEIDTDLLTVEVPPTVDLTHNHDEFSNTDLNCDNDLTLTSIKPLSDKVDFTENQSIAKHTSDNIEILNTSTLEENLLEDENTLANCFTKNCETPLQLDIKNDEKIIENNNNKTQHEEIEEQSPAYEKLTSFKSRKRSRIRLRSHGLQDNEEIDESLPVTEQAKPIKSRRLRLPKPTQKPADKFIIDECQINADVINKLIKSPKNISNKTVENSAQIPLTNNVILTKRFLKRAKAKLDQQSPSIATQIPANLNTDSNGIENVDVSLLTQISDDNPSSSNDLQDSLVVEGVCGDPVDTRLSDVASGVLESPVADNKEIETFKRKRKISLENPSSKLSTTLSDHIKDKYHLGNPQVLLPKLKTPFLLKATQNLQDSISPAKAILINSSVSLLANDQLAQKRRSLSDESDSSVKESKCLKIDNYQSVRKIKMDDNGEINPQQDHHAVHEDSEPDTSDEQLTATSSHKNIQRQEGFQSPSIQRTAHLELEQQEEQTENESDLRLQNENISNKSDLQLLMQEGEEEEEESEKNFQQQKEQEKTSKTTTATAFIAKDGKNLPHKQYEKQENQETVEMAAKENEQDLLLNHKQLEDGKSKLREIANTCNSCDNIEKDEDGRTQSLVFKCIYEPEKLPSNSSNKYSNEISVMEEEINVKYSTYSALFNKLSKNSRKRQINFENSSVNITPISSPTYGTDDTIASPSPVRKSTDFRMGGEIDGRLTYPPIPYILYEIDLGKIEVNKPLSIDKLKRTIQLDPRVFRTHFKLQKQSAIVDKQVGTAFVSMPSTINNIESLSVIQSTSAISSSSHDPRNRSSSAVLDVETSSLNPQTALMPYDSLQNALIPSSSSAASFMQTRIADAVPLALQYHSTSQTSVQPQQPQTPNMFIYGCLQRSPWYQSLMSTMKIQINQSVSQLVRALNNFHRERVVNPEIIFDVFKIDCAGELLEIMRNLGIFVDANGIINEQRHMPSFAGSSCCNTVPVNATYSFIQQYLTPNTHCTSLTTSSSTYNAAASASTHQCQHIYVNEPFVSCYIKAPEPPQKHSVDCCAAVHHSNTDNNNCNRNCNHRNDNGRNDNNNRHEKNNNTANNCSGGRRYSSQLKKPYDNNDNNYHQQRSNQRSSHSNNYNNSPRFMKPGVCSPSKSNSSPSGSPKRGFGGGRGGRGGDHFKSSKRFSNYSKDSSDDWPSSGSNDNRYNNKFQNNNNSPQRSSSPIAGSSVAVLPPKPPSPKGESDEECWD